MVANKELSEKQKEKIEKEIDYMFYELYTKRMSAEAAQELAKATYEKVKNEYELEKGHTNTRRIHLHGLFQLSLIVLNTYAALPAGRKSVIIFMISAPS